MGLYRIHVLADIESSFLQHDLFSISLVVTVDHHSFICFGSNLQPTAANIHVL